MGKAYDEFLIVQRLVAVLDARVPEDDEAMRAWLSLVGAALIDPIEGLIGDIRSEASRNEKPLWWPEDD